jgi:alpha-glucosidase
MNANMKFMRTKTFITALILILFLSCQKEKNISISSPNGKIKITVERSASNGTLTFMILNDGDTIIKNSTLGIELSNPKQGFTTELQLKDVAHRTIDEQYTTKAGKQLQRRNYCKQLTLKVQNQAGNTANFVFRVYNDGIAYRYQLSNTKADSVICELSEFNIVNPDSVWSIPFSPNEEHFFEAPKTVVKLNRQLLSLPVLISTTNSQWTLVSESDVSNYPLSCGLFKNRRLTFSFAPAKSGYNTITPNFVSPWRVMILGNALQTVVESCLIDHLAPATDMNDLTWIEPGVASFPWWSNNLANSSPDEIKKFIDLSSAMRWRWVEFDVALIGSPDYAIDKWKTTSWIKEITDYGRNNGVLCFGWDEIKNLNTSEKREDVFTRYNQLGLAGIKVDFVSSYAQTSRQWVENIIKDAAKHKLMVSFHGAQAPRGTARQYPHVMTFEAVRGAEYYIAINGAQAIPARHNCTLPFTRNVVGSMDYTPAAFSSKIRTTTMAHELALAVVFESGWQCLCDTPESYLNSVAKPFLQNLPVAWDETHLLAGYPGQYCCMARRKGKIWYIAGINAGPARKVSLNIPIKSEQKIQLYADENEKLNGLKIFEQIISPSNPIEITMQKNGGFVFIIG